MVNADYYIWLGSSSTQQHTPAATGDSSLYVHTILISTARGRRNLVNYMRVLLAVNSTPTIWYDDVITHYSLWPI